MGICMDFFNKMMRINKEIIMQMDAMLTALSGYCKECILLIRFRFYACNTEQHLQTMNVLNQQWKNGNANGGKWTIYKEMTSNTYRSRTSQSVVCGFVSPNCSINGYSQKWSCDCVVCDNKAPWFWDA